MFKQRVLTALVLIPLVLFGLIYGNPFLVAGVFAAILTLGAWEWTALVPLAQRPYQVGFMALFLLFVLVSSFYFQSWLWVVLPLWGAIFIAVMTYPHSQRIWGHPVLVGCLAFIVLPVLPKLLLNLLLRPEGAELVIYFFILIWAADTGAYIVGKLCGRCKLIPQVSPGKTIEGTLGGLCLSLSIALGAYYLFHPQSMGKWLGLAVVTVLISILGDLFISILKRRCQLKDTGQILPGHGGILDRFDSLIAALPFFYAGLSYIEHGI